MERNRASSKLLAAGFLSAAIVASGCGIDESASQEDPPTESSLTSSHIKYVFVIPLENHDASTIYTDTKDAPYITGTLMPAYAHASNFNDELPASVPSEPHYIWMEAGTNAFSDHTFTSDSAPSASNSTSSQNHLVTQIKNATNGVTWMSYQEGINATTGACPIVPSGSYHPKHNPFVFFKDVAGSPLSKTNAYCGAHHKDLSRLAGDLSGQTVANFNFITPNLCHDMHGGSGCSTNIIRAGDDWLKANLPPLIQFAKAHAGVIFLAWDEGESTTKIPFLAIGPTVKPGYAGGVTYNHGSLLRSVEEILGVPVLSKVSSVNDLADLFTSGSFP